MTQTSYKLVEDHTHFQPVQKSIATEGALPFSDVVCISCVEQSLKQQKGGTKEERLVV